MSIGFDRECVAASRDANDERHPSRGGAGRRSAQEAFPRRSVPLSAAPCVVVLRVLRGSLPLPTVVVVGEVALALLGIAGAQRLAELEEVADGVQHKPLRVTEGTDVREQPGHGITAEDAGELLRFASQGDLMADERQLGIEDLAEELEVVDQRAILGYLGALG